MSRRRRGGFSLVITLLMMVLLTLVALGFLSLSTITLRGADAEASMATARANARLGMMLALGELQKQLGPDQRTSAPAASLVKVVPTIHPDWKYTTAVMKRADEADFNPTETLDAKIRREFAGYLVSGDPLTTGVIDTAATALADNALQLVAENGQASPAVRAIPVSVGNGRSRYAWWVEDAGTKATLALSRQTDENLRVLAPDRFDLRKVAGLEKAPDKSDPRWESIVSTGTSELVTQAPLASRGAGRSITALSRAVLSDSLAGGLKRDLTIALGDTRENMETWLGERMFQPVAGSTDTGGPLWEQARQYYQSGSNATLAVRPQRADQEGYYPVIAGFTEIYGVSNTTGYIRSAAPHPSFPPDYYNHNAGLESYSMTFHTSPVLKLWNPYDRPLVSTTGYTLSVANANLQYSGGSDGSYQDIVYWGRNGSVNAGLDARLPKTVRFEHRYFIPAHTLEPGETRVFSIKENRFLDLEGDYQPYATPPATPKSVGLKTDVVAKGWILGDLVDISSTGGFTGHAFWDPMFTKKDVPVGRQSTLNWSGGRAIQGPDGGDVQVLDTITRAGLNFRIEPHPFTTWNIRLYSGRVPRPAAGTADPTLPLVNIRNVNTDVTGFNRSGTSAFVTNPDPTSYPIFLDPSVAGTMWARRFMLKQVVNDGDDKPALYNPANSLTKDAKWLANYNPRSPTIGVFPKEFKKPAVNAKFSGPAQSVTVNGKANGSEGYGTGTPGNYLSGMIGTVTSQDALFLTKAIGYSDIAGNEASVLFQTPTAGDPEKFFFSLGQLGHANLWIENGNYATSLTNRAGEEDWFSDNNAPAWPIGNSYADPRLKLSENQGRYSELAVTDEGRTFTSTFHDLSYYLNRSLWDSYFFSTRRSSGGNGKPWNTRLASTDGLPLESGREGFLKNASKLMVDGAFNVNSTDPHAWAALLASLTDVKVGTLSTANAAYPRVTTQPSGEVTSTTSAENANQYNGFRSLSPEEIKELSERIVEQIKLRGPATSLGDFVNRTINDGAPAEQRVKGVLQAAIDLTSINARHREDHEIEIGNVDPLYEARAFAGDIAAGAPGYLMQSDLLTRLGPVLTPRSDTFVIRSRGEALDAKGKVVATAICETTVQRMPDYVDSAVEPETAYLAIPATSSAKTFGRAFQIVSTRWLPKGEI